MWLVSKHTPALSSEARHGWSGKLPHESLLRTHNPLAQVHPNVQAGEQAAVLGNGTHAARTDRKGSPVAQSPEGQTLPH
jgi:hypothetical protein